MCQEVNGTLDRHWTRRLARWLVFVAAAWLALEASGLGLVHRGARERPGVGQDPTRGGVRDDGFKTF